MCGNKTAVASALAFAHAPVTPCCAGRRRNCLCLLDFASFGTRDFIYKIVAPGESAPNVPKNR